jgi:capsular polysaccharide transport system permease protein
MTSPQRRVHRRSIWHALSAQGSVIYGLMLHDITSQIRKSRLGFLGKILDPLMQIAGWFLIFVLIRGPRTIYDMNLFLFLGTGIVAFFFFREIALGVPSFFKQQNRFTAVPAVKQADIVLAAALSEAIVMTIVAGLVWSTIVLGQFGFAPADPFGVITSCACLAALGAGFGWFNAMVIACLPVYQGFVQIIVRISFFTSGAIFPLERIPPDIFQYLRWFPVYQGVDLVRSSWSYTYDTTTSTHSYVLIWAIGFLFFGLLLDQHALRARQRT